MSTPPLPPPLPPPPTEADLEDLERFAKRRGVRASLGSSSGSVSARSKDASARTKPKGRKENRNGLTKKVTKAAIKEALSANYASGAVPRKRNAMDSKASPAKDSAFEQKHRASFASVPPPPPPPPPLPPAAAPPVPPQMPSALHIHNAGLSDFEYESKDDASQLSSPRSRSWTGEDSMGGHEQKDEVLHDDDPPPLPPLPITLEDEEAITPFEIPSPPAALPDMPSPITNVDNVPRPPPPLQNYEDSRAPELSLSSELPSQASEDITAHKPKPPHLPPPTMPGEMSQVGAEGPQEEMSAIFAQLRRNRVPSTTNEAVFHGVMNTQGQEQDESLEQQSYVATDSEMSTTIATNLAGRRVSNPSPMPAEPPQEGMSAIFAQLRRNRVPSTANEAVVHGVAGLQQREHDEPLDQTPLGTASTEPEVSRFETGRADRRLVAPSSMPTEPSQEDMSAIFAQLRRNRVPSTTNEAVVHGIAKTQQREHDDSLDLQLSKSDATKPNVPTTEASTTAETKSNTTTESNEHHSKQTATDMKISSMPDGLEKYRLMLKAGLPEGAVRHALARDGKQVPVNFFETDSGQPSCEADDVSIDDDRVSEAGSVQSSTSAQTVSTTGSLRRLASLRRLSQQRKSSRSLIHEADIKSHEQEDSMSDEASSEAAFHEDDSASVKADVDRSASLGVDTKARGNSTEHRLAQVLEIDEVVASADEMVTDAAPAAAAIPPPPPPPPEGAAEKKENAEKETETSDVAALSVQNTAAATAATAEKEEVKEERERAVAAAATTVAATAEVAAAKQQQHQQKFHKQREDVGTSTAASGKEDVTISSKPPKDVEVSPKTTALESNGAAEVSMATGIEREVLFSVEEETELLAQLEAERAVKRKEEAERAERARQSAREQEFRSALVFRRTRELEQIGFMAKGHAQELDKAFEDVKGADLESFDALSKLATKRQVIMEACLEQVRSKPLAEDRAGLFGSADERPRSFSTGFVRRRKPSVHEHDPVELLNKVSHVALKADIAQEKVNAVLRECSESRERIHALQQRIDESENILENARIPEGALRSKLAELEAVHRLQRSLQDAEFHTLEKRCKEVAKRIEALGREEKARILEAAERKSAKALGAVRRNLRDSKHRLASEHAQDLAALEEKSKGVDAAMQRKTTAEFRRVLSRQVDVLKEKRAAVETQIAERKHERTLAEREAAVLARDLQQHLLPPVSTRAEADAHIGKLRDQHATSQRKKMDRFERELSLGWSKMRGLGLSEEQAKHKLILLRKLEACIVASPELVHMYQNMVRKLQEAVPILLAEQELVRLGRAVERSAEVLESNQVNETAEKEALRAINRLSDAMRELRAERDSRRVHWEREHGALPLDWHASQDIE